MIIVIYVYRFFKAKDHHHVFPILQVKLRQWEVKTLAAGSESNLFSQGAVLLQRGKKEFQNLHFISFSLFLISAGFTYLSVVKVYFPWDAKCSFFLIKVVVWCVKAAFPGFACSCNWVYLNKCPTKWSLVIMLQHHCWTTLLGQETTPP